jgi:CRP-like cAMP-binding protein
VLAVCYDSTTMLLEGFTIEERQTLTGITRVRAVPAGEVILHEGFFGDSIFLVAAGQVQVRKDIDESHFKQLKVLGAGEFFGDFSFLGLAYRSATVVALDDCEVWQISRVKFQQLVETRPLLGAKFYRNLARGLAARLRDANEELRKALLWAMHTQQVPPAAEPSEQAGQEHSTFKLKRLTPK